MYYIKFEFQTCLHKICHPEFWCNTKLGPRWWFHCFFLPVNLGVPWSNFGEHIFSTGLGNNHQPEKHVFCCRCNIQSPSCLPWLGFQVDALAAEIRQLKVIGNWRVVTNKNAWVGLGWLGLWLFFSVLKRCSRRMGVSCLFKMMTSKNVG